MPALCALISDLAGMVLAAEIAIVAEDEQSV
jgi:hypothetical protein